MTENNQQIGGIRAKRIQADNVVSGWQIQDDNPQHAISLIQAAERLRNGAIDADEIVAQNVVSGLQYLNKPSQATREDLRNEIRALQTRLEQAIAAQEIPHAHEAKQAKESLAAAESELSKKQPDGGKIIQKLDETNSILTKSAQAAESAGKLSAQVIKLAPIAAIIWQVALRIFHL